MFNLKKISPLRIKEEFAPRSDEGLTLLVSVCKKRLATVGGDGYEEVVLYLDETKNKYTIHTYYFMEGMKKEAHVSYVTSKQFADKLLRYMKENNLSTWKDNKGIGLCGCDYILKFIDKKEMIRLDSSKMPDNLKAYGDIKEMLYSEIRNVSRY